MWYKRDYNVFMQLSCMRGSIEVVSWPIDITSARLVVRIVKSFLSGVGKNLLTPPGKQIWPF